MKTYSEIENSLKQKRLKWVVTGAAGFIGSHLSMRLLDLGQAVLGLDNLSTGLKSNIDRLKTHRNSQDFEFIQGDVLNRELCSLVTRESDIVLHQAAIGSVPRSIREPLVSHDANVHGFINILDAARLSQVKKFVYASSSSVYGSSEKLPKFEDEIGEPLSPYAATKRINEIYAKIYFRSYGMPVVGLRYFNVFGPYQNPNGPYAAVIPLWMDSLGSGGKVFINGDGSYSRDFCYVENVVQANLLAAFSDEGAHGRAMNIACGERTTLKELFDQIASAVQAVDPRIKPAPAIYREQREGDIPHSHADISLAAKILGYKPVVRVVDGLMTTATVMISSRKG